jgi:peptidoglycan hydrolase CwlO-like protein
MKNFHQNLLIVLALALCVLCAYQWYGQTLQRGQVESMNQLLSQKLAAIQGYTNSIKDMDAQIAQMDGRITELKGTIKTNDQLVLEQKREINRLEADAVAATNQIVEYKRVIDVYKEKLEDAYAGVKKQNEAITNLVAQRDDFVKKLNDSVKDRNDIVAKYNDLVARVEKMQGGDKGQAK